jgi:hypothetical protein
MGKDRKRNLQARTASDGLCSRAYSAAIGWSSNIAQIFPKRLHVSQPEKSIGDCIHFLIVYGSFDSRNENLPFSMITFKGSAHGVCAIMYVTEKVGWKSPWQEEKR